MESKIYSRPRFCTTGKGYKNMPRNNRRYTAISIITIIVIAVITFVIITRAVNPIINDLCIDKAKNIATQISNDEEAACKSCKKKRPTLKHSTGKAHRYIRFLG